MTTLNNNLNEWLHTGKNWEEFSNFVSKKLKTDGLLATYKSDNKLLTDETRQKLVDVIKWTIDDGAIQFKRGDYRYVLK